VAAEIGGDSDPAYAIQQAVDAGLLKRHTLANNTSWLAVPRKADAEGVIARSLARLLSRPAELWPDASGLPHLSDHQRGVLACILTKPVAVLTGTPGTGKTFSAAQVIKAVMHMVPPDEIAVCAPTGKAAVRITKAMHEYGLDLEATTVHRLLKIAGQTRDGFYFQHNADNPLPYRVVILDEGSMMDTDLEAALLDALAPGTHLLIVGDPYQLPPVGHGAPLRDLIDSGVLPPGELSEIRRNSGQIVAACQDIKNGFRYVTCDAYDDGTNNFRSLEAADADAVLANVRAACRRLKARAEAGELAPGFDPVEDVQVLCVVNEKSTLGRYALNRILQEELNPASGPGQGGDAHPFRTGDKVICLVNGKMACVQKTPGEADASFDAWYKAASGPPEKYIANGDMGRVLAASPSKLVVRISHPERTVLVNIPAGGKKKGGDAPEGEEGTSWGPIDLGYAVTAHKSQGSEWPFVIIPIDESERAKGVVSRELLYTAISRAKWRCLLVGRRAVADEWCQTVVMRRRKTLLKERIVAAVAKMQAQPGQGGGR
jgi:exodeoxyribonuclease V alpha subunit